MSDVDIWIVAEIVDNELIKGDLMELWHVEKRWLEPCVPLFKHYNYMNKFPEDADGSDVRAGTAVPVMED